MIRVAIADDHKIVRNGIITTFDECATIQVVGEAANGQQAVELARSSIPDVLLMDISMPVLDGVSATRLISKGKHGTRVIILSMHENEEYIHQAFDAGAEGYLLKDADNEEIIHAVKTVAGGEQYVSPAISGRFLNSFIKKAKASNVPAVLLTSREKEILGCIVQGLSNKMIAHNLYISVRTVDAHRANIMKKLAAKNTAELVKTALEQNFIS
jgi:two-component system, NarL family, response regulator NreC